MLHSCLHLQAGACRNAAAAAAAAISSRRRRRAVGAVFCVCVQCVQRALCVLWLQQSTVRKVCCKLLFRTRTLVLYKLIQQHSRESNVLTPTSLNTFHTSSRHLLHLRHDALHETASGSTTHLQANGTDQHTYSLARPIVLLHVVSAFLTQAMHHTPCQAVPTDLHCQ